ncbi:MAG: protein kinase, partial [Parachlamydiaceae bacterium]|nr:protein kinase [Parachlamydiaceae bacterium]
FETLTEPIFIKRYALNLPRSLAYVPDGYHKGIYALLKTHGKVEEVGLGSFYRATLALPLDLNLPSSPNSLKVFRSGKLTNDHFNESKINKLLLNECALYSVGSDFIYLGPVRSRYGTDEIPRELNGPKEFLPREENVKKVGYISDYLVGGTLCDILCKGPNFSFLEAIIFALKYTHGLAILHDTYEIIHRDQKPENVFLTSDWDPKIGDFGFAVNKGKLQRPCGSIYYLAPEILQAATDSINYSTDTPSDVWGLGLILFSLFGVAGLKSWQDFFMENESMEDEWDYMINNLEHIKSTIFLPFRTMFPPIEPLIEVIDECLQKAPDDRATAIEVFNKLGIIYYALLTKDENLYEEIFKCQIPKTFI